jgi:hypothetical protein
MLAKHTAKFIAILFFSVEARFGPATNAIWSGKVGKRQRRADRA